VGIEYTTGDLFDSVPTRDNRTNIVCHVCNDIGKWGSGFVVPLGRKYPSTKITYLAAKDNLTLGKTQFVPLLDGKLIVANMIAQHGIRKENNKIPLQYDALEKCMLEVADYCKKYPDVRILAPKFGSDRAGGDWGKIENIIKKTWTDIDVTIFILGR
jgi:hypothetical protein